MKKFILYLSIFCFSIQVYPQDAELYETVSYRNAVKNGTRSRDGKPGPNYWQNHADYDISVRLDTTEKKIYGNETIIYYNESPDTLDRIVLRLYPDRYKAEAIRNTEINPENVHEGINLDSISINGRGIDLNNESTRKNGTNMALILEEPLPPGNNLELVCTWNYQLPFANEFRREGFYKDKAWFVGYFYPQIAVYDDMEIFFGRKGWDFRLFHQGLQEFYNDFNNFKVQIEVPEGFYVWATGELTNSEEVYEKTLQERIAKAKSSDSIVHILSKDDIGKDLLINNIWQFEAKNVPDFGFGTSPNYLWDGTSVQLSERRVFVDVAYHPDSKIYPIVADIAKKTIEYASHNFPEIEYPYSHATTFNGMVEGGMEFPMIANNSDSMDTTFILLVTFHEIFHNYTPFMMGFNEKRYPFMDEGLTEFITNKFLDEQYGKSIYSENQDSESAKNIMDDYNFFAGEDDIPMINAYASLNDFNFFYQYYIKPIVAYKLFMETIGEENFKTAFREFVNRWKGKHPTPWDFFYTFNDVLGENYNWFWKAWFFDLGYPDLGLEVNGNTAIVKRVGTGSLPLPVTLTIEYKDGSVKTIKKSMDVWKEGANQIEIELENASEIKEISLDVINVPDIDHSNNIIYM
jgi:hypothetical protein